MYIGVRIKKHMTIMAGLEACNPGRYVANRTCSFESAR